MKERLKQIRKNSPYGKTQDAFAEFLGISKQNISSYETGRRSPSDGVIQLICQKCHVNKEWLLTGKGDMESSIDTDYESVAVYIGETDPKAKQAILEYWKLSDEDKELFWKFFERFMR